MEISSTSILRILPARESKVDIRTEGTSLTIRSQNESKSYKFGKVFNKGQESLGIWEYLTRGSGGMVHHFLAGNNTCLITYGEVNSGKSYSIFGQEGNSDFFKTLLEELFKNYSGKLGLSVWEILYSAEDRSERIIDLLRISDLRPLPHSLINDFISVEVSSISEAECVFDCAKELSANFKERSEGGFRCLNNRAHFFVRVVLEQFSLCIVDLAGSLPGSLAPEIRVKLGCDEQLNVTRIGLNQFRSIIWEMSKSPGISVDVLTASRKSKLSLVLAPLLTMGKNFFFGAVKEDSVFEDICKNLDVVFRAQNIVVRPSHYEEPFKLVPFNVFVQRNKVAKYWEGDFGTRKSVSKEPESKQSLKDQISQMINDLDFSPVKSLSLPQESVIVKQQSVDYSKLDSSVLKVQIFQQEMEEIRVANEVEIENLKLENSALRQKIRVLQEGSSFLGIFDLYEQEIGKMEKVIRVLREDQVNALSNFESSVEISGNFDGEMEALQRKYKKCLKEAAGYGRGLEIKLLENEKELGKIKKNERKWLLTRRCFENMTRKTVAQESLIGKQTRFLQVNDSTFQEMIQELEKLEKENEVLKSEQSDLLSTTAHLQEELKIMKEIAATSGMPEETLNRIHKNLKTPSLTQGDFLVNLIKRLQQDLPTKKHQNFIDNILHEVENLIASLSSSQTREKNLFEVLLAIQNSTSSGSLCQDTNRTLRKTLLAQLT